MERLTEPRSLAPTRIAPRRGPLAASQAAGRFRIDPGSTLHLAVDTDLTVEVDDGRIWLTAAGDARDHFPGAGARLEFAAGSDLMIEAEGGPALVTVIPRLRGTGSAGGDGGGDGLGHGPGFVAPGKPLVRIAALAQRNLHAFAPLGTPASSTPGRGAGGDSGRGPGRNADGGSGDGRRSAVRAGLADWARAIVAALKRQRAEARARQLLQSLDSRQLRDIGAAEHVILRRERLEREARMRARMTSNGV